MNRKGSLLFETFVALMILSIGITSTLRVFGEALFVGTRNQQTNEAQEGVRHLLFKWFAHPGGVRLPDGGALTLPLDTKNADPEIWSTVQSQNLSISETASAAEKQAQALKENQYYAVQITAQKNYGRDLLGLKTVVFQSKKAS